MRLSSAAITSDVIADAKTAVQKKPGYRATRLLHYMNLASETMDDAHRVEWALRQMRE
ncbi:hypothetical protein [Paraburkholderia fynbosensis]|uniref:hypothetical protein n=1 Tax=Paraburkholderia fynbosensis TaxID=1200993 RepID=UPI0015829E3F|nr:hypothetical protein [Paraburkholderia fynbosensis]